MSFALLFSLLAGSEANAQAETAACAAAGVRQLVPVGEAIGVKMFADGVLIVGFSEDGGASPARESGLREGDILTSFNETKITSTEHLQALLQENGTKPITFGVRRGNRTLSATATPTAGDGYYRLGAWIRDSMAGIGTMTFYDPVSGVFGALGHGISDTDTEKLMPLSSGSVTEAKIKAVQRGASGAPGELRGDFDVSLDCGSLYANTDCGVFGILDSAAYRRPLGKALPVASQDEIRTGKASILASCDSGGVCEYEIEIEHVYRNGGSTQNMLLRVSDPALLGKTGGIVQGMSGSPILQNGKIVGAVTHVLVNDPTRGYGIFIENMLDAAGLSDDAAKSA